MNSNKQVLFALVAIFTACKTMYGMQLKNPPDISMLAIAAATTDVIKDMHTSLPRICDLKHAIIGAARNGAIDAVECILSQCYQQRRLYRDILLFAINVAIVHNQHDFIEYFAKNYKEPWLLQSIIDCAQCQGKLELVRTVMRYHAHVVKPSRICIVEPTAASSKSSKKLKKHAPKKHR